MPDSKMPLDLTQGERRAAEYLLAGSRDEDFDPTSLPWLDYDAFFRLSPVRCGALSWYPFNEKVALLEWGGGMGEMTGLYCRRCERVVSYEENGFLADVIRKRHHGEKNLTVTCSPPKGECFDLVVVLDPPCPTREQAAHWRALLAPHGRLLVAAGNRLSARLLSGGRSRVAALPFADAAGQTGLLTRQGWEELFAAAGFAQEAVKCFYPAKDHHFPQEIYTDTHPPTPEGNSRQEPTLTDTAGYLLNDDALMREAIQNGAFPALANSFLWECRDDPADAPCPVEYAAITENRAPEGRIATLVLPCSVEKRALHPAAETRLATLAENHKKLEARGLHCVPGTLFPGMLTMPRIQRPTLLAEWHRQSREGCFDEAAFWRQMHRLVDVIHQSSEILPPGSGALGEEFGPVLREAYLELVPANCFVEAENGALTLFDQEFCETLLPVSAVVSRAVANALEVPAVRALERQLKERYQLAVLWPRLREIHNQQLDEIFNPAYSDPLIQKDFEHSKFNAHQLFSNRLIVASAYWRAVLARRGWRRVGVYGYGGLGQAVCHILAAQGVEVAFALDARAETFKGAPLPVLLPEMENLPPADGLLVALRDAEEARRVLAGWSQSRPLPAELIQSL